MLHRTSILIIFLAFSHCSEPSRFATAPLDSDLNEAGVMNGYAQYEWEMTHDPATGTIPVQRLATAQQILAERENQRLTTRATFWRPIGPADIGGRTRALLIDANDASGNTIFAGSTSGGLFRSRAFKSPSNAWEPVTGIDDNLSISAIVQDPNDPDVIYVGTGEGWGSANDIRGAGVWRSMDGGKSWTHMDAGRDPAFWHVLDIDVDRSGNVYVSTRANGVQKSTDAGVHWTPVLGQFMGNENTDNGGDLELGPDGSLYASLNLYGPGKIYKSDFSTHQAQTGNPGKWEDITPPGDYWRIELAVAPTDAKRVYALCAGADLKVNDMWRSEDGGKSWKAMTIPSLTALITLPFSASAAWFALIAQVDPNDANTLYIGGIDLVRTDDGGNTWTHLSSEYPYPPEYTGNRVVHTDQHEILFFPGSSSEALFTNDGGIYYSNNLNTAAPTFQVMNHRYNTTQFYSCALFPDEELYLGGCQDNGNWIMVGTDLNPNTRYFLGGGDGGYAVVNQKDKFIFAVTATGIDMAITTDGAASFTTFDLPGRGEFINPYTVDDETDVFYGALEADKYFIIRELTKRNAFDSVNVPQFQGAQITALTADPHASNRLWVAVRKYAGNGRAGVFRIDNAHTHNPTVAAFSDPNWNVELAARNVFIDANDPNYLLVTFANYGSPNVWITKNGGQNWTNVDGDLPDMPVRWGLINPLNRDELIIATELGVLHSTRLDGSNTKWEYYQAGLPKLRVNMLASAPIGQRIVAATWGQGMYLTEYDAGSVSVTQEEIPGISVYPNPVTDHLNITGVDDATAYNFVVYDVQGHMLEEGHVEQLPVSTSQWQPGTYMMKLVEKTTGRKNLYKLVKVN